MGRWLFERPARSIEASHGMASLRTTLRSLGENAEIREYVMLHYLLLCARTGTVVDLLSLPHHCQISFDFQSLWPAS